MLFMVVDSRRKQMIQVKMNMAKVLVETTQLMKDQMLAQTGIFFSKSIAAHLSHRRQRRSSCVYERVRGVSCLN